MEYFSGIWGCDERDSMNNMYYRAIRYYLGAPKNTSLASIQKNMGWLSPKYNEFVNYARLDNRMIKMRNHRLCKYVFLWNVTQNNSWYTDLLKICDVINHRYPETLTDFIDIKTFKEQCWMAQNIELINAINQKPKLRTYNVCKDY